MKQRVDRPTTDLGTEFGALICRRCGQPLDPGQLWLPERHTHVACPSKDQVRRNRIWARARAILAERT